MPRGHRSAAGGNFWAVTVVNGHEIVTYRYISLHIAVSCCIAGPIRRNDEKYMSGEGWAAQPQAAFFSVFWGYRNFS